MSFRNYLIHFYDGLKELAHNNMAQTLISESLKTKNNFLKRIN